MRDQRWISITHHLPERTRLRTPVLRKDPAACERLADHLAAIAGVREVKIRPYTGSILVEHTQGVTVSHLVSATRSVLGLERVLAAGEPEPLEEEVPPLSSIARQLAVVMRQLDRDIRRATDGFSDLGTLATLAFLAAGAVNIVTSEELPLPPWFNLAWWGFRTFVTLEQEEINAEDVSA